MNNYLSGIIAQFINPNTLRDGSASTYGLIPAKGSTLTISFIDQDVVGREASRIRGYSDRLFDPNLYFGWKAVSGSALDIRYNSTSVYTGLINQGFINATSELSRVSGLRFAINPQSNVESDINYFVNNASSAGEFYSNAVKLPLGQTVTSSEFEIPPQSPFALIGLNQEAILGAFGFDAAKGLNWLGGVKLKRNTRHHCAEPLPRVWQRPRLGCKIRVFCGVGC